MAGRTITFFGKKGTIKDIFTVILGLEGRAIFNVFSIFSRIFFEENKRTLC